MSPSGLGLCARLPEALQGEGRQSSYNQLLTIYQAAQLLRAHECPQNNMLLTVVCETLSDPPASLT